MRAELDAAVFRLFGLGRDETDYIMETFPIVKRKEVAMYGEYRTKWLVLAAYDALTASSDGSYSGETQKGVQT